MTSTENNDTTLQDLPVVAERQDEGYDPVRVAASITVPPDDYDDRYHIKWLMMRVPPTALISCVLSFVLWLLLPLGIASVAVLLIVAITTYLIMRFNRERDLRPIRVFTDIGSLVVSQAGGDVFPWFLNTSPREVFPFSLFRVNTPPQTLMERLFFKKCGTLEIMPIGSNVPVMVIHDVKNRGHIVNIYEHWYEQEALQKSAGSKANALVPDRLQAIEDQLEELNTVVAEIRDFLKVFVDRLGDQ